jgi:hypothetical protein
MNLHPGRFTIRAAVTGAAVSAALLTSASVASADVGPSVRETVAEAVVQAGPGTVLSQCKSWVAGDLIDGGWGWGWESLGSFTGCTPVDTSSPGAPLISKILPGYTVVACQQAGADASAVSVGLPCG